jgi:hypothetical protein
MHVRSCSAQLFNYVGERVGSVDKHLDGVALAGRGVADGPPLGAGLQGALPTDAAKPSRVMATDLAVEAIAQLLVKTSDKVLHVSRTRAG